jgi:2-C-methyl-D-erythritol 2,4-cyclodiphosphate synthase
LGDIGMHFPDSDSQWKGADSKQFLAFAAWLVRDKGYEIVNVDTTVILERPKLKDFRLDIREAIAKTMAVDINCVSVKFKTAERVGPVGEGKSAEAQAIVLIEKSNKQD